MEIKIGETYSVVPYFKKSLVETETFRHVDDDREVSLAVGWRTGTFHVRVENEEEKELLESSLGEGGDVWDYEQYSNIEFCDSFDGCWEDIIFEEDHFPEDEGSDLLEKIDNLLETAEDEDGFMNNYDALIELGFEPEDCVYKIYDGIQLSLMDDRFKLGPI